MKASKIVMRMALVAAVALQAGLAIAQQDEKRVVEEQTRIVESEARFDQEMKEAEERLAEAARRVAELSAERLDKFGSERNFVYEISDRPRLGVNIGTEEESGPVEGVRVISVTPGSAADDAGLRAGDVITAVNGESMSGETNKAANGRLLDFMRGVEEGDKLELEYLRDGKVASVEVEPRPVPGNFMVWAPHDRSFGMPRAPEVHPAPVVVDRFRYSFGGWRSGWGDMEVVELTEGLGRYFGTNEGLLVISAPKTNDFKLQEGDVIQSIDGRKPESVDHCMRILASYQPGESLELRIMRDKRAETIRVEVPDTRTGALPPVPYPATPATAPAAPMPALAPLPESAPTTPEAAPAPTPRAGRT